MTGADGWGLIFEDKAYRESLQRRRELRVEDWEPNFGPLGIGLSQTPPLTTVRGNEPDRVGPVL